MAVTEATPRSAELRTLVEGAADKVRELRQLHPDRRPDTWADDLRSASTELLNLDREFEAARSVERYDLEMLALEHARTAPAHEARGPEAAFRGDSGREARSAGERFIDRDEYREFSQAGGRMPAMEMRTLATTYSDDPGGNDIWLPIGTPTLKAPRQQRFFLRDLLDVAPTTLAAVPYIRELTPTSTETGAAMTAQGSAKAEVENKFEQDTAVIQKVTAWIPVTEEVMMDAPLLAAYITNRLSYMLQVREQAQVLNGNGTAPQIKGILQFSGVQTQAAVNDDPWAVFGLAAGKIENVDGYADGIAMNPLDYWAGVVERHANQFDGNAQGNAPFGTPTPTVWGLPVVRTRALSSGDAIVGDWAAGATLLDRQSITVRQSDSHDDYFVKNKVAVLAEERIGLAVHRPDFFVDCTVAFT
ncbi:MAG TPA: phage major capsid protein [Acidimicrobiales bacterium]